jgi:hypothetical protein
MSDTVAANVSAWDALKRVQPVRITDPETRHLALRRLREHIDAWIDRTDVYVTPGELPTVRVHHPVVYCNTGITTALGEGICICLRELRARVDNNDLL